MPNTKEKLIELIKKAKQSWSISTMIPYDCTFESWIADHLIAHGVTVQECGHWKIIMDDYDCEMMCCSVCGSEFYDGDNDTVDCMHNYCPNCGAKMTTQPPKGE